MAVERHMIDGHGLAHLVERLRQYLPPDLSDELLGRLNDPFERPVAIVEVFVHLASVRYTLSTYLPRVLVQQTLRQRRTPPWLARTEGSLLFADLSGSTALAERLATLGREGIELVTAFLNDIFAKLIATVQQFGGDLVAFGGDALLVFFSGTDHARAAAWAALALQEEMKGYSRTVPGIGTFPMHLHIGIDSGPLAFFGAGQGSSLAAGVLGPMVNRVAVAEGLAAAEEVVAGPGAVALLRKQISDAHEVAAGFVRFSAMRGSQRVQVPDAEADIVTDPPEIAIPQLLNDLDLITPYIPRQIVSRILSDPQRPEVEAELRPVTVIFAQIGGLELFADHADVQQAADWVDRYVVAMQTAIERFGGVVNKLDVADEGLKLVAIFGAPIAYEDHADRATRASIEMQQALERLNQQLAHEVGDGFVPLRQRIGLNLGTVFAGNVGSALRKEYTVMGDAVNVAARVMSAAAWNEIWCSDATLAAIKTQISVEPRGTMTLRGRAMPLALSRVLDEAEPKAPETPQAGRLIGRDREMAWLREQLQSALAGAGRAVRIVGEAGIGKSRLLDELLTLVKLSEQRVIRATCYSYTATTPYAAWGEWLRSVCGIVAGDEAQARTAKLSARLAELGAEMVEWLPLLADLVRLDADENRLTRGLDPQLRQERRFELLVQLLRKATEQQPLVVVFEDLHWADPISLDLWQMAVTSLADRPILLLGVHRPVATLFDGDQAQILTLTELAQAQSIALLDEVADDLVLSEQVRSQLIARAEGNPFYLIELVRLIRDRLKSDTSVATGDLVLADLPESLNGLLLSRIDQLDETSRGVLRVASVIGQRIPFGVLQSLQSGDQQSLLRHLARLDEQELTQFEREHPERIHAFRHGMIQEVAYQSILFARRRELHGRIGAYLEQRYAQSLDDYLGLIAHHYRLSDQRTKAIQYLLLAGHAARAIYANDEAEQNYRWALEALEGQETVPQTWEAREGLADVYATIGRYDEARRQLSAVLEVPEVAPDVACRAYRKRAGIAEKQGRYVGALEDLGQALQLVKQQHNAINRLEWPLILAETAHVYQRRAEYDQAVDVCEDALRLLHRDDRTRDDEWIEARLHSTLGTIYGMRADYPRARHHFERSLKARESIDDLPGMAISHNNLGYLWQLQSEYQQAIDHYHITEELAAKINLRQMMIFAIGNEAYALISSGRYRAAEQRCLRALELSEVLRSQQTLAQSHNTLAIAYYHQGAYEQAAHHYQQALAINRSLGSAHEEATVLANLGLLRNTQGNYAEAFTLGEQVLHRAEQLNAGRLKAEALIVMAEALMHSEPQRAHALGSQAADLSTAIGSKLDAGIAHRLVAIIAAAAGEPYTYDFEESIALFEAIKEQFELARTWAAYGFALQHDGNPERGLAYLKQAQATFTSIEAVGELRKLDLLLERRG